MQHYIVEMDNGRFFYVKSETPIQRESFFKFKKGSIYEFAIISEKNSIMVNKFDNEPLVAKNISLNMSRAIIILEVDENNSIVQYINSKIISPKKSKIELVK